MTSTKQVDRDFRWKRVLGVSAAILLAGVSAASYLHPVAVSQKNVLRGSLDQPGIQQSQAKVKESVAKLPLAFEPNMGQTDAQVKYVARAKGYTAFLTADSAVLSIKGSTPAVLRMKMQNTQPVSSIQPGNRLIGKSNYVRPQGNIMGVPNYGNVTYKGIYPGIDLAYLGNERNLEYDFVVNPGADPSQIRIAYEGSSRFALDSAGNIELETAAGKALAQKPVVYQTIRGARKPIQGEYVLMADNQVGFKLGAYDRSQALVIDPTLNVLAFLSGTGADEAYAIATNPTGIPTGVYLTGRTTSINFLSKDALANTAPAPAQVHSPAPVGNYDAFVTKLDPTGTSVVYSTYLGTAGDDGGEGIVVDATGIAYVTGYTNLAMTAPSTPAAGSQPVGVYSAFLAKFTAAGALSTITYFGGAGTTQAFSIAMDPSSGNLVIGGLTNGLAGTISGEFKTPLGGTTDGFIATFNTSLALQAATYLGGSNFDQVNSVAVDNAGNIYAAGVTASGNSSGGAPAQYLPPNFPTGSTLGLNALGVPDNTFATSPAVPAINVQPVSSGGEQTAFVTKYNSTLTARRYSSIFGPGGETANGIAVDAAGIAYVVGSTHSIYFDPGATQPSGGYVYPYYSGSLPATTPRFGVAIAGTVNGGYAYPPVITGTQGYVLSLLPPTATGNNQGLINWVGLQTQGASDPAVGSFCNLGLTRFGGSLSTVTSPCSGKVGSWNNVAVDSDGQAYIAGQAVVGAGPYYTTTQIVRTRDHGALAGIAPQVSTFDGSVALASSQAYGVAVTQFRLAFFDGSVVGPAGVLTTGLTPTAIPIAFTGATQAGLKNNASPGVILPFTATKADTSMDGLYGAIQYIDVYATPSVVVFDPVGLRTGTGDAGPTKTINLVDQYGIQNTCAGGTITITGSGSPFTVAQIANTATFQIQFAAGATNAAGALGPQVVYIGCSLNENVSVVTITGSVTGPLNLAPAAPLASTSVLGSGLLTPYTTLYDPIQNNFYQTFANQLVRIPVSVVNPGTSGQPYTVHIEGQSVNFPSCGLLGLDLNGGGIVTAGSTGNTGNIYGTAQPVGTTPTQANGSIFAVRIDSNCARTLPVGTYSANVVVVNALGVASPPMQASVQITGGGAVSQFAMNLGFLSNTSPAQQTSFSVNAQATPLSYGVNYVPAPLPNNPFPATNVQVVSGGLGTVVAGGTNSVIVQISPANLGPGVYQGIFQVTVPGTSPLQVVGTVTLNVYVANNGQVSLVSVTPASPTALNISVPAGFASGNLTQPANLLVSAVGDTSNTPLSVGNVSGIAGITAPAISTPAGFVPLNLTACFLPLPGGAAVTTSCALRLTALNGGNTCNVFAPSPQNSNFGQCSYGIQVDTTLVPPGTYTSVVTLTATNGFTLGINVNLVVTAFPGLMVRQTQVSNGALLPVSTLNFNGVAGQDVLQCQSIRVDTTGGTVPGIVANTTSPWIGMTQQPGNIGNGGSLPYFSNYNIGTLANPNSSTFSVCVDPVGQPNRPATLTGTVTISGSGVGQPIVLGVNFTLSGGAGGSASNLQQLGVFHPLPGGGGLGQFALDNNGNFNYDAPNPNLVPPVAGDKFRTFGLVGDKPVAGDWFGTGVVSLGVFRCPATPIQSVCAWYIDGNNNGVWDGVGGGDQIWYFGLSATALTYDQPIVGDWTGNGVSKIGVMRCPVVGLPGTCTWYMDAGNQHGLNGSAGVITEGFGLPGDQPVVNNWTGNGPVDQIGVFRCPLAGTPLAPIPGVCTWYADVNGTGLAPATFQYGVTGDIPIVGNWFGTGLKRIGVFHAGSIGGVTLNLSGNNTFVLGVDFTGNFGLPGDLPVVGFWTLP